MCVSVYLLINSSRSAELRLAVFCNKKGPQLLVFLNVFFVTVITFQVALVILPALFDSHFPFQACETFTFLYLRTEQSVVKVLVLHPAPP